MRSNDQTILLTRSELYDIVWKEPIFKLAKEWFISDVGLSKVCRRHDIPIPPRGYWSKLKYGKAVPKRPVLPKTRPADEQITISTWYQKYSSGNPKNERNELIPIDTDLSVPAELTDPHPMVDKTARILRLAKKTDLYLVPRKNSSIC